MCKAHPAEDQLHQGLYRAGECDSHVTKAAMLTERHLNLLSDTFDAHECERDDGDDGYSCPAQFADHSEGEGKKV